MAIYETINAIRLVTINASTWTDVAGAAILPISCNMVAVYNSSSVNIYMRTDPANANSQVTIGPGAIYELGHADTPYRARYPLACQPVCALLSSSGTQSIVVESSV